MTSADSNEQSKPKAVAKKFIAFSGGVESTTMALLFGRSATPLFADTGFEHREMYERLDRIEVALQEIHGEGFKIQRVSRDETLQEYIQRTKFYPSPVARFCTRMFKIEPMDEFLKDQGECELMIGLNADEADRTGNHGLISNVTYTYPLIDLGITRDRCLEYLKAYDLQPHFPPYMQRGGCVGCFYKSKKEFTALALLNQTEADMIAELEASIQDERGKHYGIRDGIPNMREFINNVKSQTSIMSAEKLYETKQQANTPCGVFCHR